MDRDHPGYNMELLPIARRVVEHYQRLFPVHSRSGAIQEVIGRMNDGVDVETLTVAADAYSRHLKRTRTDARYACNARNFYSLGGEWERFGEGECPGDRADRERAEEARQQREAAQRRRAEAEAGRAPAADFVAKARGALNGRN